MPFGWNMSQSYFEMMTRPIVKHIKSFKCHVNAYSDDILLGRTKDTASSIQRIIKSVEKTFNMPINQEKSTPKWRNSVVFLGYRATNSKITVPTHIIERLKKVATATFTAYDLEGLKGKLAYYLRPFQGAQQYLKRLNDLQNKQYQAQQKPMHLRGAPIKWSLVQAIARE